MIDECSRLAYEALGLRKLKGDQELVLYIFKRMNTPLCAREVHREAYQHGSDIDFNGVRSRITELTEAGYLEKLDKENRVKDSQTGQTVNRWKIKTVNVIKKDLFE